jgi:DNA (cytosine-5)-methyltransferase 1
VDWGNYTPAVRRWGEYEPAIQRWEAIMDRPAPNPTQPGRHGRPVLSGRFVEFLMGLDDGFVSSLDIPRTAQLRALGNGVVPQQVTYAMALLLADFAELITAKRGAESRQEANAA